MRSLLLLLSISLSAIFLALTPPSSAQTPATPQPSDAPLDLSWLMPGATAPPGNVVTASTIDPNNLTVPSLWWAQQQAENKLVDNWIAYPATNNQPARVDLIVNEQIWSLLDYVERYDFVNKFGTVARDFGYNLRVFNYEKERLATYTCNFSNSPTLCGIQINTQSRLGVGQKPQF